MNKQHGRTWLSIALIVTVGLGAFAGVARGSDDENTIHACGRSGTGTLRTVGDPSECKSNEESLDWNVTGPAGMDGKPGLSGYEVVERTFTDFGNPNVAQERRAFCGSKRVLGGGYIIDGHDFLVVQNRPEGGTSSWVLTLNPFGPSTFVTKVIVYAVCANVSG